MLGLVEQQCGKCRGLNGELYRKRWGCDEPTPHEQYRLPCYGCDNDTYGCALCDDRRWVPMYRCPKAERDEQIEKAVRLALWSRDDGPLPARGGALDQSAWFMDVRDIVTATVAEAQTDARQ